MNLVRTKIDNIIDEIGSALRLGKLQSSSLIIVSLTQEDNLNVIEQALGTKFTNASRTLAEQLAAMSRKERRFQIEPLVSRMISQSNDIAYVSRINLLFDKSLNVDPLKLFHVAAKKKPIVLQWPGNCDSSGLSYAKPGLPDHKSYKLNEFQDVQVITTCEQGVSQ